MPLLMTDIEVRLPDRKRTSTSFSSSKPMANVFCSMENGHVREILVPARVGRALISAPIPLPLEEGEAFDAIHALEARICFTLMTEILSRRDHASKELHDKLKRYGYRDQEIEVCMRRAAGAHYIDDIRFAASFIDERKRRGWGRRRIERELELRGVSPADLEAYPDAFFSEEDDLERASALLERKPVPDARPFEKLVRHLMSKGFDYPISARAARMRITAEDL